MTIGDVNTTEPEAQEPHGTAMPAGLPTVSTLGRHAPELPATVGLSALTVMLRQMALIRATEERIHELFQAGELPGFIHLAAGQEAAAVGVISALQPGDYVFSTFRNHGHALAMGVDPARLMAEMYGRETGTNRGRGGSMHIADHSVGLLASGAIVGASPSLACGPAFGSKLAGDGRVSVAFFGDGAMQQGTVFEAINLASVWDLPAIFVCENNNFGQATPISAVSRVEPFERARAYGIPGFKVDGQDVEAVFAVAAWAAERARSGDGPTLIEAQTHAYFGAWEGETKVAHRLGERDGYFRARDPLAIALERLVVADALTPEGYEDLVDEIADVLDAAVEFARSSPAPDPSDLTAYVHTPAGAANAESAVK